MSLLTTGVVERVRTVSKSAPDRVPPFSVKGIKTKILFEWIVNLIELTQSQETLSFPTMVHSKLFTPHLTPTMFTRCQEVSAFPIDPETPEI